MCSTVSKGLTTASIPVGALIFDKKGVLYGTTHDGTVFKEVPPAPGHTTWTLRVIYRFNSVLGLSAGGLIAGKKGVMYGATAQGGSANEGTVFQLTPPVTRGGAWTSTTLHEFVGGSDGEYPLNGLTADKAGNLYGATESGGASGLGTVFKLAPTQHGAWTKTTLHQFTGGRDGSSPGAGLIFGSQGVLYGATVLGGSSDNGTVFKVALSSAEIRKGKEKVFGTAALHLCSKTFEVSLNPRFWLACHYIVRHGINQLAYAMRNCLRVLVERSRDVAVNEITPPCSVVTMAIAVSSIAYVPVLTT
jgi:uncharacterized repeat protein (TIGR03803 family)